MLKNKSFFLGSLIFLLTFFLVSKTTSFFLDSVQGDPIKIKMAQWVPAVSQASFVKDGVSYSIEEKINSEKSGDLKHNFISEENQYLSFQYKVDSSENALGFDEPNFLVKVNDEIVFQDIAENNLWKKGYINLKNHKSSDSNYLIEFLSENTFDEINSPNLTLKEIGTSNFLAKKNDLLKFSVSKPNADIYLKYLVEENGLIIEKQEVLPASYEFSIAEHFYNGEIEYYSIDSFGNTEDSKFIIINTDFEPPEKIDDIVFYAEGDRELSVIFTSPTDSFSNFPAFYEVGMLDGEIAAISNHKKFGTSSSPSKSGRDENILIKDLDLGKDFFTIKSVDQAGNYSEISNIKEVVIH